MKHFKLNKKNYIIISAVLLLGLFAFSTKAALINPLGVGTFGEFIDRVIGWAAGIAVPLAILMTIFAALMFMTAGGSPERVKKGVNALTWAVIGLGVVIFANPLLGIVEGQVGAGDDIESVLGSIINYLQLIGGPLAILMFIWGALLLSTGNMNKIKSAYSIFLWTSIGVAIILVASGISGIVSYFIFG